MVEDRSTFSSDDTTPDQNSRWLEQITIWPHRSLSPKGFTIVMGVLAGLLFIIGLGFFLAGAWPVIGFLGLELLVVWGAFKLNYRAARHRETIHTTTEELMVESQTPAGKQAQKSFPIGWLRVSLSPSKSPVMSSRDQQKIILSSHGEQAEIGKYLHPAEKAGLSREIGSMIDRARATRDSG